MCQHNWKFGIYIGDLYTNYVCVSKMYDIFSYYKSYSMIDVWSLVCSGYNLFSWEHFPPEITMPWHGHSCHVEIKF